MIDTTSNSYKDPVKQTPHPRKRLLNITLVAVFFALILIVYIARQDTIRTWYVVFEAQFRKPDAPPVEIINKNAAGSFFKPLVNAMNSSDDRVVRYSREILRGHVQEFTPDQVRHLLQSMNGRSKSYKDSVQGILTAGNNQASVEVYGEFLDSKDPGVRLFIVRELSRLGGKQAVEPVGKLLADPDVKVRAAAANFLAMHRDPRAVGVLLPLLSEQDPEVVSLAVSALSGTSDPRAVEPIIQLLAHPDKNIRKSAANMLGWFRDKRAVEPLISCMKSDKEVAGSAAASLGVLGDSRAFDVLVAGLKNDDEWCRTKSVESLGMLRDPRAVPYLLKALQDKDQNVRVFAAQSLGQIGDASVIPALDDMLEKCEGAGSFETSVVEEAIRQIEKRQQGGLIENQDNKTDREGDRGDQ